MSTFTQDMPPKEGYRPFQTERIRLRALMTSRTALGLYVAITAVGHLSFIYGWIKYRREQIETDGAVWAIGPMLIAERDRAFLKQVKKNLAEEKHLMRYIPGWVAGTWFGEPIYKTIPEDQFLEPVPLEFLAHTSNENTSLRLVKYELLFN